MALDCLQIKPQGPDRELPAVGVVQLVGDGDAAVVTQGRVGVSLFFLLQRPAGALRSDDRGWYIFREVVGHQAGGAYVVLLHVTVGITVGCSCVVVYLVCSST